MPGDGVVLRRVPPRDEAEAGVPDGRLEVRVGQDRDVVSPALERGADPDVRMHVTGAPDGNQDDTHAASVTSLRPARAASCDAERSASGAVGAGRDG